MQVVGEGGRRRHKLIAEDDLGKTMPSTASYCYCLLLHATACYCLLLHPTACHSSRAVAVTPAPSSSVQDSTFIFVDLAIAMTAAYSIASVLASNSVKYTCVIKNKNK